MTSSVNITSAEQESASLRYVEGMAEQLQCLVPGPRYGVLRYLLDMARLEAKTQAARIERERLTGLARRSTL